METAKYSPVSWSVICIFLDCVSGMTQATDQDLLNQQTLSLPSESFVVNDIAEKKLRSALWECVKKVKHFKPTDDTFPLHIITNDWNNRGKRTKMVNGWNGVSYQPYEVRVESGFQVHNLTYRNAWLYTKGLSWENWPERKWVWVKTGWYYGTLKVKWKWEKNSKRF